MDLTISFIHKFNNEILNKLKRNDNHKNIIKNTLTDNNIVGKKVLLDMNEFSNDNNVILILRDQDVLDENDDVLLSNNKRYINNTIILIDY